MKKAILALLLLTSPVSAIGQTTYTFGVVPQQAASKLARLWTPILAHLGRESGLDIQFKTAPDIPEFERRLAANEFDFAYMNPYHFTVYNEAPGYRAVARARDKRIRGILVVRQDSPIESIEELHDMTLAFPAPAAFAANILPRSSLAAMGNDIEPRYVSSHDSVYRSVARGLYPAGGGVVRTFRALAPEIREQLRVLWTTEGYTPHAIAASARIPAEVSARLRKALIDMEATPQGRQLLENLKLKGFEAARDEDWDDVRALNIHLLDVNSE